MYENMCENKTSKTSKAKKVLGGIAIIAAALLAVKGCETGYTYFKGRQEQAALAKEEQRLQLSEEFLKITEASKDSDVTEEYRQAFEQIRDAKDKVKSHIKASQLSAEADKSIEEYIDDKDLDEYEAKYEGLSKKFMADKTAYVKKIGEQSAKVSAFNAQADKDCGQAKDCSNVLEDYLKDDAKKAKIEETSKAYALMMENIGKDCENDSRYFSTVAGELKNQKIEDPRKDALEKTLRNYAVAAKKRCEMAKQDGEEMQKRIEYMSSEKLTAN